MITELAPTRLFKRPVPSNDSLAYLPYLPQSLPAFINWEINLKATRSAAMPPPTDVDLVWSAIRDGLLSLRSIQASQNLSGAAHSPPLSGRDCVSYGRDVIELGQHFVNERRITTLANFMPFTETGEA